jgi:hypothetical protein
MGEKIRRERHVLARAKKKKGSQLESAEETTDAGASTTPVDLVVTTEVILETAIESDEQVAVTARPSKAKVSARSRLGAALEAVAQIRGV